ncbi:MAG: DUF6088 family protein [Candidatus Micrarchaeota archaeon]
MRFGERELALLFALEERNNGLFSFKDAKRILKGTAASVKNVLSRLAKKNRVIRLQKGSYLFAPLKSGPKGEWSEHSFLVAPALANTKNYYIGFLSALNHWGMTTQIPMTVFVALNRQKKSVKAVQTTFVFVKKRELGEFTQVKLGGTEVNVSTREQTIIDCLRLPQYCLGVSAAPEAIHSAASELDWGKLVSLAKAEKHVVRRRLGYILELMGFKRHAKQLEGSFQGFRWLDPSGPKHTIKYSKKWGLKLNLEEKQLLNFRQGY